MTRVWIAPQNPMPKTEITDMADIIEAAQADFEKAKGHYEHFLQVKFGAAWEAHYGDYTYDMSACIGRTFFRGMHEASKALEAAKSAAQS